MTSNPRSKTGTDYSAPVFFCLLYASTAAVTVVPASTFTALFFQESLIASTGISTLISSPIPGTP